MNSIANFIILRWWICAALAVTISIVAVKGLLTPTSDADESEAKAAYKLKSELDGDFGSGGGDVLVVVDVEEGTLFEKRRLALILELEAAVERADLVQDVLSLSDIKVMNRLGLPTPLIPKLHIDGDLERVRKRALAHPFGSSQLLSQDARTMIMPVRFTRKAMESVSYEMKLNKVRKAVDSIDATSVRVRLTGLYPLWAAEQASVSRDRMKFMMIGCAIASLLAIYLFRSLWVAAAIGIPAFVGVFWAMGLLTFVVERPTPLTQVVMPMMLTMVGFTDAVHLMFHIRRERCAGLSRVAAAISSVRELGVPCMLSSLTTAIGFGSLIVAEAEVIRSFGISCAIGVVLTFLAVVTLVPLLSLTWLAKNVHLSQEHDFMEKHRGFAERVVGLLLKRARWVVVGATLLMLVFGSAASTLRPDNKFLSRMPDQSEAYQAMAHVDKNLGGTQVLRVALDWDEGSMDEAALVAKLEEVEAILADEELLGASLSLRNVLASLPGKGELVERVDRLGMVPEGVLGGFYRPELNRAVVATRVQDLGIAVYKPVFARVDAALKEAEQDGLRIVMTGDPIIWGRYLDRMVWDLVKSLALASGIILLVMGIVYRSVRIGLIAIVPNLFPIVATGAMLAFLKLPLVIETVCAFTICLGIAVDDTIHFLSRYRAERLSGCSNDTAIRESFLKVGSPLLVTTTLMVTGFATVLWSELPSFRMFGAMACATLVAAFVADLLILPALLKVFHQRPKRQ